MTRTWRAQSRGRGKERESCATHHGPMRGGARTGRHATDHTCLVGRAIDDRPVPGHAAGRTDGHRRDPVALTTGA
eukprot:2996087-Pyramimonas_sp.AAC.1